MLPRLLPLFLGGGGGGRPPFRAGTSTELDEVGLFAEGMILLRRDGFRCGGGGGVSLDIPGCCWGVGDAVDPVVALLVSVASWDGTFVQPGTSLPGLSCPAGNGKAEGWVVATGLEKDGDARWPAGRLGGGGTGAAVDSLMLEERDLTESIEEREGVAGSSGSSACGLLSVLACAPLRGGGAGFLSVDVGFWTGVEEECDMFGGVGGRGEGTTSASGSMSTSGTFPAASLSNMLSLWSYSDGAGGSGRGLLTSVGLREALRPDDVSASAPEVRRSNACGRS